jgi:pyochelin biosynthesis protein PchC
VSVLLCFRPQKNPSMRLVAFPWAGASASSLRPLCDALARETSAIELHVVAYAGRSHRRGTPSARSLDDVVEDVLPSMRALRGPVALYGHSFGAVVAFDVALAAERRGAPVSCLVAAARAAPSVDLSRDASTFDDAELAGLLARERNEPSLADDPEMRALFFPPLRQDLLLSKHYRSDAVIDAPIIALHGRADDMVDEASMRGWRRHTRGSFRVEHVEGAHLFVRDRAYETARLLHDLLVVEEPTERMTRIDSEGHVRAD